MADRTKFNRVALIGSVVAVTYIALYMLFIAVGLTQILSNAGAFLLAVALQYVGQAGHFFDVDVKSSPKATRFGLMICCGLITSAVITGVLGLTLGLPYWIPALVGAVVLPMQNYLIMTRWVHFTTPNGGEVAQ